MNETVTNDLRLQSYLNIFLVASRLQAAMDKGLPDVSSKQWLALRMLETFPEPPTLKSLAQRCGITRQSAIQLVERLNEKGFVSITPDSVDRRAMRIALTETYFQWTVQYAGQNQWFLQKLFSDLTEEELGQFCVMQGKLMNGLEQIADYLKLCL